MKFNHFTLTTISTTAIIMLVVLVINLAFDPLWYFNGNQMGPYNHAVNERLSKLNQLKKKHDINCIVYGSSKATFLKARSIQSASCFNLAVSHGKIEDFNEMSILIEKHYKFNIEYLFVGVESWDIFSIDNERIDPNSSVDMPPHFLPTYLSFDSLRFSRRLFLNKPLKPRIYDENFEITVVDNVKKFTPLSRDWHSQKKYKLNQHALEKYLTLVKSVPVKTAIFYAPPISAWHIIEMERSGNLIPYLNFLYQLKEAGYRVIDYSIISLMTKETKYTWDGIHYYGPSSNMIIQDFDQILSEDSLIEDNFGLDLSKISFQQYLDKYLTEIQSMAVYTQ